MESGRSPCSPATTARSVPWPRPVQAREPSSTTPMRSTRGSSPAARSASTKAAAARIGPTVWEEDGPMPILNRSKALIMRSGFELARHLAQQLLHVGNEGAPDLEMKAVRSRAPQHDGSLREQRSRAHPDREGIDMQIERTAGAEQVRCVRSA